MSEHAARIQAQTHDAASHTQCDHTCAHLAIARRQLYPSIFDGDTSRAVFSLHHMADLSGNTNTNATLVREVIFGETLRVILQVSGRCLHFARTHEHFRDVILQVQKVMFVSSIPE